MTDELDGKQGVQSLEVGMSILRAMAAGKRAMMLKDIAAATEMPPSKVHRYLVSLIRSGLVEQDPMTSRYDLGAFALNLGLVALDRIDRIRLGLNAIVNLRDAVNETTALGVWSPQGPIVIRWERPRRPITVNVVAGTPLAILNSALGRAFAAWLPEAATDAAIQAELATGKGPTGVTTLAGTREFLADIRAQGYSAITGDYYVNGVEAVAHQCSTSRTRSPWRSPWLPSKARWISPPPAPPSASCAAPHMNCRYGWARPCRQAPASRVEGAQSPSPGQAC